MKRMLLAGAGAALAALGTAAPAQPELSRPDFRDGPWEIVSAEQGGTRVRVSVVTEGLDHPWSMVWLPDGDMLITERRGGVRRLHDGRLDPLPLAGLEDVPIDQLFDIALHPDFERNGLVYMTYMKQAPHPDGSETYWATTALMRAEYDGRALVGVEDVFVADAWRELSGGDASRILFAPDGRIFMSSSHRRDPDSPQDMSSHVGKILRLEADGSVPDDNPFAGRAGVKSEIWSAGHRTVLGLTFHPVTGALWETENGPQGGDEVNIIRPGLNYGWPLVTYGRDYDGTLAAPQPWRDDLEPPVVFWVPSIAASGLMFYSGSRIPAWRGNLFVGAMTVGRVAGTGRLERIVFAENGGEIRRESLLGEFHQRIRDVREGPDGLIYLLTDETRGLMLVIGPAD